MNDFQDKTEYDIDDIFELINNEIEESIHLDFKAAGSLDKSDGKKKEISKDVSAFANSDGGIIVYGIKEENHKASEMTFIDGDVYTKEWLEQTISSSIQKRISDLKIYPIRNNGNIKETIYVVKIPNSLDGPHMCKDKRFYKRFNFESVMMEEYEVRQSYGRRLKSKLIIDGWNIGRVEKSEKILGSVKYLLEINIFNDGDIVESDYKINVYFVNYTNLLKIHWDQFKGYDFTQLPNAMKVSAEGKTKIYPDEKINVMRVNMDIPTNRISDALKDIKLKIVLLYSNGQDEMNGDLKIVEEKLLSEFHNML